MGWGMAISHIDPSMRVFGPPNDAIPGSPASYFINPVGIQSIILSAAELGSSTVLTTDNLEFMSVNAMLQPQAGSGSSITFPAVHGMAFITGLYSNLQPAIQSSVFFRNVVAASSPRPGIFKYSLSLEDGNLWLLYATPSSGIDPNLQLVSSTLLQGMPNFSGSIQVGKNPTNVTESYYDAAAGAYATGAMISGYANGSTASYNIAWHKGGQCANETSMLMFALPHHMESFDGHTAVLATELQLQTPTKGLATAIFADSWTLTEDELPIDMGFAPWRPGNASSQILSSNSVAAIQQVSAAEASQNMSAQTALNSMYYSGKASPPRTTRRISNPMSPQPSFRNMY